MTEGTEKIIRIITEEAELFASDAIKNARQRAEDIRREAGTKAEKTAASYREKAEMECAAIAARAVSSAEVLERNILLDTKNVIIDGVYREAERALTEKDGERYFKLLLKTLLSAVSYLSSAENKAVENGETDGCFTLTLNQRDRAAYGERLIAALGKDKGIKIKQSERCGSFNGGLKVEFGSLTVSSTTEVLFKELKEKNGRRLEKVLFSPTEGG